MDYFSGIYGNQSVKKLLSRLIERGDIWRTYLFSGVDGVGKFLFAERFALVCLCEGERKPCGSCRICVSYSKGVSPFIKVVSSETGSITVSQVRDILEFARVRSPRGKFVIVRDAGRMTQGASNAFLKTLEEVPEKTAFILIAPSPGSVLPTIRSRSFLVRFKALTLEEFEEALAGMGKRLDKEELSVLYILSGGSFGVFTELMEGGIYQLVERLYYGMKEGDREMVSMALSHGSPKMVLESLLSYLVFKLENVEFMEKVVNSIEYMERNVKIERIARYLVEA